MLLFGRKKKYIYMNTFTSFFTNKLSLVNFVYNYEHQMFRCLNIEDSKKMLSKFAMWRFLLLKIKHFYCLFYISSIKWCNIRALYAVLCISLKVSVLLEDPLNQSSSSPIFPHCTPISSTIRGQHWVKVSNLVQLVGFFNFMRLTPSKCNI